MCLCHRLQASASPACSTCWRPRASAPAPPMATLGPQLRRPSATSSPAAACRCDSIAAYRPRDLQPALLHLLCISAQPFRSVGSLTLVPAHAAVANARPAVELLPSLAACYLVFMMRAHVAKAYTSFIGRGTAHVVHRCHIVSCQRWQVDGIAGPNTKTALYATTSGPAPTAPAPTAPAPTAPAPTSEPHILHVVVYLIPAT